MKYFERFPTVNYDTLGDGVYTYMTDFTPNFKVRNASLIANISYMNHIIGEGERPDVTSHMLYGTTEYHWSFFVINENLRKGIGEWPLSQSELDTYIASKYNKYAVITFDPTLETNLSYVPFTDEYIDSLYLAIDTVNGIAYRKIIKYDTSTCQMIIERNNPILNIRDESIREEYNPINIGINTFINEDSYRIVSILFVTDPETNISYVSGPNQDFVNFVNNSYGLTEEEDSTQYFYHIAKDSNGNDLNYELMKNAPYQFYRYINDEPTSISTYDAILSGTPYTNINRITYEEMEEILNSKKKTISVINPANITKFAQSYFTVLNNG